MKKCNRCKVSKELTEFKKRTDLADGRSTVCKQCAREVYKENNQKNKAQDKIFNEIMRIV